MKSFHIKSILLVSSLCCLQASAQTVSYTKLVDDPTRIAKLIVHIDPFYADSWGSNVSMGYSLRAGYEAKNGSLSFDWRRAYFDEHARLHSSTFSSADPLKKFQYLEAGVEYYFVNKEINGDLRIVLSSRYSGSYTYTTSMRVPAKHRKIRSLRFGVQSIRSAIYLQDSKMLYPGSNSYPGYDLKGYSGTEVKEFERYANDYTMMNIAAMHAGVSMKNITNLIVKTETYKRKKNNAMINDLYLDFLYAPVITFANVIAPDMKEWEIRATSLKRSGWRIGWSYKSSSLSRGAFNFEFGSRPGFYGNKKGVLSSNPYFLFVLGWTIPFKLKG